jgi:tight adherence protein B
MNLQIFLLLTAAFAAVIMLFMAFSGPSVSKAKSRRLANLTDRYAASTEAVVAAQMRKTIQSRRASTGGIASILPRREEMVKRLRRTGKNWDVTRYSFAIMGIFVVVTALLLLFRTPFLLAALLGALGGFALPHFAVNILIRKRSMKFTERFPDAIDLLVRGLRAGLPITETFTVVAQEIPGPVGEEFKSIVERIRIGNTMDGALQETADLLEMPEFQFFCITITIQRETGGNLAETFSNLSDVLRKRAQMKLKIRAMSSEAKASAYIVGSLPFFVFAAVSFMNPEYSGGFFTEPRLMIAGAFGLIWMGIGAFIMAKMISFEI